MGESSRTVRQDERGPTPPCSPVQGFLERPNYTTTLLGCALVLGAVVASFGLPALAADGTDDHRELITNSTVDHDTTGWRSRVGSREGNVAHWAQATGRNGTAALMIGTTARDSVRDYRAAPGWGFRLTEIPLGWRLHFGAWVRGEDCTLEPVVGVRVLSEDRAPLAYGSTERRSGLTGTFGWTHLDGTVDVVDGAARVEFVVLLLGGGTVWFDDLTLTKIAPLTAEERTARVPDLAGYAIGDSAYVFEIRSVNRISRGASRSEAHTPRSRDGLVRMQLALPLSDAHQVPLDLDLWTEPNTSLRSANIHRDKLGNSVADLTIDTEHGAQPMPLGLGTGVLLNWKARVMVLPEKWRPLPHVDLLSDWPEPASAWLRATPCAQSDDPQIGALAKSIATGTRDIAEIVSRTLDRVRRMQPALAGNARNFDAVGALSQHGSCVSQANLVVALLRANGIPTRQVSGFATWAGPHTIHIVAEVWVPGEGWVRIEPSRFEAPWPASMQVNVAVLGTDAEVRGAETRPGGVQCLPYLAISEFVGSCAGCRVVGVLDSMRFDGQQARKESSHDLKRPSADWGASVEGARESWDAWLSSSPALTKAGHLIAAPENKRLRTLLMK